MAQHEKSIVAKSGEAGIAVGSIFTVLWKLGFLDATSVVANPDLDEHGKILESARKRGRRQWFCSTGATYRHAANFDGTSELDGTQGGDA